MSGSSRFVALAVCVSAATAVSTAQAQASRPPAPAAAAVAVAGAPVAPQPAPAEVGDALARAGLIGRGTLRFFGLPVYEVRLWAAPGFDAEHYETQPFALELEYARKLDGAAIAERSIAEMKRVGPFSAAQAKGWLALMKLAFPSVAPGDRLVGLHAGDGAVSFFHNGQPTAALRDAQFARLFFGIWLAPQTSSPALREALLGTGRGAAGGAARSPQ